MSAVDLFIAYKFLKILTTPFEKTDAFKFGIINKDGKILKKHRELKTGKEKVAYTIFHRLGWNLKRLLNKFGPTRTRLGSFAAALYFLKEEVGIDSNIIEDTFIDFLHTKGYNVVLNEKKESNVLSKGDYVLLVDVDTPTEPAKQGDVVKAEKDINSFTYVMGQPLYKVRHIKTGKILVVSDEDIQRI